MLKTMTDVFNDELTIANGEAMQCTDIFVSLHTSKKDIEFQLTTKQAKKLRKWLKEAIEESEG